MSALPAVQPIGVEISRLPSNRLDLPDDLTLGEWLDVGRDLCDQERSLMWRIGDWLLYGEERFGSYKKLSERDDIPYKPGTLANAKYVAKTYPPSFRNERLTFAHHMQAAKLPAPERAETLQLAAENDWTVSALREEIQRRRAVEIVQQTTAPSQPFDYALRCLARLVGAFVDLDPAEFIGSSKGTQAQVNARQMVMYLLLTDADFREIDIANGLGRHHSTVDHAVEKFTALREETEIDDALTRLGETYRLFRNTQAAAGLIAEMTA